MEDEIVLKSCDICGKTFTPKRETHYRCSDTCRMIYERQYAWARWDEIREKNKARGITKLCSYCGEEFKALSETRRTCSRECSRKYQQVLTTRKDRTPDRGIPFDYIRQHLAIAEREPIPVDNFQWPPTHEDVERSIKQFLEAGGTIQVHKPAPVVSLINNHPLCDDTLEEELEAAVSSFGEIL